MGTEVGQREGGPQGSPAVPVGFGRWGFRGLDLYDPRERGGAVLPRRGSSELMAPETPGSV